MHVLNDFDCRAVAKMVLRQLQRRFGEVPQAMRVVIVDLPGDKLEALCDALLDFGSLADAERWVAAASAT